MSLKPQSDRAAVAVTSPPKWGILAEAGDAVSSIRFECADGAYSYPYHALTRWVLQAGVPERLVIDAGADKVTVCGRGLEVVRDGLDAGRLRAIRALAERYVNESSGVIITSLKVERLKRED